MTMDTSPKPRSHRSPKRAANARSYEQRMYENFLEFFREHSEKLASSGSARFVYGIIDHDEFEPGKYPAQLSTSLGDRFEGMVREKSDTQSGLLSASPSTDPSDLTSSEGRIADVWAQARDEAANVQLRLSAIHKLLGDDREHAINYVTDELARQDTSEDWVVALVFLAEDVHFPTNRQQGVKESLLRIANSFRRSTSAGAERVVWSAIRRASSLLAPQEVSLLVPFLDREGVVDARAVALKCVEKLFVPAPPTNQDWVRPIGDRAHTLAMKFLDPDIFGGGEYALLAQSAVCTLAAIGDPRLSEVITLTAGLNRRWLKHQLRGRLASLRSSWQSKGEPITSTDAFRTLGTELTRLS